MLLEKNVDIPLDAEYLLLEAAEMYNYHLLKMLLPVFAPYIQKALGILPSRGVRINFVSSCSPTCSEGKVKRQRQLHRSWFGSNIRVSCICNLISAKISCAINN